MGSPDGKIHSGFPLISLWMCTKFFEDFIMGPLSEEIPVQFGDETETDLLCFGRSCSFLCSCHHLNLLKFKDRAAVCRERDGKSAVFKGEWDFPGQQGYGI